MIIEPGDIHEAQDTLLIYKVQIRIQLHLA